jgi:hypothetical protein
MSTAELDAFVAELRSDARLATCVDKIADELNKLDIEADGSTHALVLLEALLWIAQQPRPLVERIEKQRALLGLKGRIRINLKEFCGW